MISPRWLLLGAVSFGAIALLAAALVLRSAHGFSAREQPTAVEGWIARRSRSAALPSDARARTNPVPNTPEVLAEDRAHWADHCAMCHANDGSGDTSMGKHTYPPAPDMRLPATQRMSDGELFYLIQNGIRLTAMPFLRKMNRRTDARIASKRARAILDSFNEENGHTIDARAFR
jgi:hypothetical protein